MPAHLALTDGTKELRQRMTAAAPQVEKYSAEARMTYFGPQGRVKGSAILAVARPNSLRYDVIGPHGSPIEAFACNGKEMQLLLPSEQRFIYGPATAENIDKLLRLAPLQRDAESWVALLFGQVLPPATAQLSYDDQQGRFLLAWRENGFDLTIEVDPVTSRILRATMSEAGKLLSVVDIKARGPKGIPNALKIEVPAAEVDLRVVLRDLEYDSDALSNEDFVLQPPRGFTLNHIDTLTPPDQPQKGPPDP